MALCVRVRRTLYISDAPLCVIENPQIRTRERGQRWLILLRLFFSSLFREWGGGRISTNHSSLKNKNKKTDYWNRMWYRLISDPDFSLVILLVPEKMRRDWTAQRASNQSSLSFQLVFLSREWIGSILPFNKKNWGNNSVHKILKKWI